jgi:hypothetical protein
MQRQELLFKTFKLQMNQVSKVVKASVYDSSAATTYIIAYAAITGPTTCNLANGPIILQEGDALLLDSSVTTSVSGTISIMEVNRGSLTT